MTQRGFGRISALVVAFIIAAALLVHLRISDAGVDVKLVGDTFTSAVSAPATNFGAREYLRVGQCSGCDTQWSFIKFDVSPWAGKDRKSTRLNSSHQLIS